MTAETYNRAREPLGPAEQGDDVAAAGVVLAVVGFAMSGLDRFYQAYLVAYVFWPASPWAAWRC